MGIFHWFLLRSVLVHDKKMRMSKDKVQLQSIVEEVITLARQSSGEVGSHSLSPGAAWKCGELFLWRKICFTLDSVTLRLLFCLFLFFGGEAKLGDKKNGSTDFLLKKIKWLGKGCFSFRSWFWWECSFDVLQWNNRISDPEAGETSRREV